MNANMEGGIFGFERFFKRDNRTAMMNKGDEEVEKVSKKSGRSPRRKKSSREIGDKTPGENGGKGEGKEEEACGEFVMKAEAGKIKLTEIINKSIKEAVLNMVKEGVCPLGDSPDNGGRDASTKAAMGEDDRYKENKPASPKNPASSWSTGAATFDSHLCRNQNLSTLRGECPPCGLSRIAEPARGKNGDECDRETCPQVAKERRAKVTRRRKEAKSPRESSGKVSRPAKAASHFRTDNRRMTGNVNIYICSEANEAAKDAKKNEEEEDPRVEESETSSGALSVSTSKLVAALKRKKKRESPDDQSSSFVCETPEDSDERGPDDPDDDDDDDDDDDLSCLCDDDSLDFQNSRSSSTKDCRDFVKFSCSDFAGSDLEGNPYDGDDCRCCAAVDCPSWENERRDQTARPDQRCFCRNYTGRPQVDRGATVSWDKNRKNLPGTSCRREATEKSSKCPCIVEEDEKDGEGDEGAPGKSCRREANENVSKCPCIAEEDKKDSDGKAAKEGFGVCVDRSMHEALPVIEDPARKPRPGSQPGDLAAPEDQPWKPQPERNRAPPGRPEAEKVDTTRDPEGRKNARPPNLVVPAKAPMNGPRRLADWPKSQGPQDKPLAIERAEGTEIGKNYPKTALKGPDGPPKTPKEKWKSSYFQRLMSRAMSLGSRQKDEKIDDRDEKVGKTVWIDAPEPAKTRHPVETARRPAVGEPPLGKGPERALNPERKTRSKISMAIASRKNSIATSKSNSDPNASSMQDGASTSPEPNDSCQCGKPRRSQDCCGCCGPRVHRVPSKSASRRDESAEKGDCGCVQRNRFVEVKACNCCQGRGDEPPKEVCERCRASRSLCRCDPGGNSGRGERTQPRRWHRNVNVAPARCDWQRGDLDAGELKSMICVYCDNPRGKCACRAPIRKCSRCRLPLDVCDCAPTPCRDCDGRRIRSPGRHDGGTISVTAWKPRRDVGRYFARSTEKMDKCDCWENSKIRVNGELPYQNRDVFSDVMSELQRKMSGSVCCNVCKNVPCRCRRGEKKSAERNIDERTCTSSPEERRSGGKWRTRSRSDSPAESCKCGPKGKNAAHRKPKSVCDECRTTPCSCQRSGRSPRKRPRSKCFYCKNQPCTCVSGKQDAGDSRPFRNAESPRRRGSKEPRGSCEKNLIDTKIEDRDNGRRARDDQRFVPCPGKQQRTRKCCYRESPNATDSSHRGERVR